MSNPHVCVILSGCGFLDGAEIHEAVISLLALSRAGASVQCTAPDKVQMHVVNHLSGDVATGEQRNVLVEAARIARGAIIPLSDVNAADYDAVFLPGGFGAAKNLSNLAVAGPDGAADPDLVRVLGEFHGAGKPIGAVCISPAVTVMALGKGNVTIGSDPGTAGAIGAMGGSHTDCPVTGHHVDAENKIVTAPAYMCDASIADVAAGIEKAVTTTLEMCG
jgi:enhancing lycopene biosynthesis protein 2